MATQFALQPTTKPTTIVDPDDKINELTAAYFAVAILSLLVLFTALRIVDLILGHRQTKSQGALTE